jgi:hypothetical protein
MAAFNIQEALIWKEKIELVIDQVCCLETALFVLEIPHFLPFHLLI